MREAMYTVVALLLVGLGAVGGFFFARNGPMAQAANGPMVFSPAGAPGQVVRMGAPVMKAVGADGQAIPSTFGTVKSVTGNSVEVETSDGTVNVNISDKTTIDQTVRQTVKLEDLKPGARIVVLGGKDSSGAVDAQSVNLMAEDMMIQSGAPKTK